MSRLIDADALIAWIKGSQQMTSKMKAIICYIKTEPTTEDCSTVPTISKMEQVDKDINVRSKGEPQTCSVNGRPYDCGKCEYFRCTADEPQERSE